MGSRVNNTTNTNTNTNTRTESSQKQAKEARLKGKFIVGVNTDDKGLYEILRKFGIEPTKSNLEKFIKDNDLTSDELGYHQEITLNPKYYATIKSGQSLWAFAKASGLPIEDFYKLNGITNPDRYPVKEGEKFFVSPNRKTGNSQNGQAQPTSSTQKSSSATATPKPEGQTKSSSATQSKSQVPAATPKTTEQPQRKPVTPSVTMTTNDTDIDNLVTSFEKLADDNKGAVSMTEFRGLFNQLNKNNIVKVIEKYEKKYHESFIHMITDEWSSDKNLRKDYVMKVYDMVAEYTHSSTSNMHKEFASELNDEFDKLIGRVSTKNLDKTISTMIAEHKELSIIRPSVVMNNKNQIVASEKILEPTHRGKLNGKKIIINIGHGGYNPNSKIFDPGTCITDTKGRQIEEWHRNTKIADLVVEKLREKGATVVLASGHYSSIEAIKDKHPDATAFVSIHQNYSENNPDAQGQMIGFYPDDQQDGILAIELEKSFKNTNGVVTGENCNIEGHDYKVLEYGKKIPSVLIETGYLTNKTDLANAISPEYREKLSDAIVDGIINFNEVKDGKTERHGHVKIIPTQVHIIKRGDALSTLAEEYGVSLSELRELNKKQNDSVKIGEVIKIPSIRIAEDIKNIKDVATALNIDKKHLQKIVDIEKESQTRYKDSGGVTTSGIGHAHLSGNNKTPKTSEERYELFANDLLKSESNLYVLCGGQDKYEQIPDEIKTALLDFMFNKGNQGFNNSPNLKRKLLENLDKNKSKRDWSEVIAELNYCKNLKGEEKSGLCKRRLMDMSIASEIYRNNNIPNNITSSAQKLYNNGIKLLKKEFPNSKDFKNQLAGYNEYVRNLWGDKIKLSN